VGTTVIEIKCPFSGKDGTIEELVANGYSHIVQQNGKWQVNKTSPYYCQIQGEIVIKNCTQCHFVVWTMHDIVIIDVPYDKSFWENELFPKLVSYFYAVVKPKLVNPSQQ
jgi:hypothetical protein